MKKITRSLPFRNVVKRPGRSTALLLLAMFLSFSLFGGTLIVRSLQAGLSSLQDRLGADIMVVPYEASTKSDLQNIVLQGNTGYFYMDRSKYDKIASLEGVGQISPQFFLASASAGCCSAAVQVIGFDPKTDFTISPWIRKSYQKDLSDLDVVVGSDLNTSVGDTFTIYGTDLTVAAKLERTGTYLDTAAFTNEETIRTLIRSSLEKEMNDFGDIDPDNVVSCVLLNVADGYTVDEVLNDINLHVRKVVAVKTRNMISGVSQSLGGVSRVVGIMIAVIWILALAIMVIAFVMSTNERKKEFAVLRCLGASRKKLSAVVLSEGLLTTLCGSVSGILLGLLVILPFSGYIETQLGLPFLLPSLPGILLTAVISLLASVAAGGLTASAASRRISRIDTGLILREA